MRTSYLPFCRPSVGEEEIAAVVEALHSGWVTTGPKVKEFETKFAEKVGAKGALAVSSCTAALHLALLAHGVGPGDEVITTTMTFAATVNCIEHVGATPVLVDVEPETLNIDPLRVEETLSARTRALIAVHYGGHPAELGPLRELCDRRGIHLIEDAAHSLPASYRGESIGSAGNLSAFSFYATKNLTTGEGGMLTGSAALIEKVRPLALHGMTRDAWRRYDRAGSWFYEVIAPGHKYNLTDPAAAMGLVQLSKLDSMQERRQQIVALYRKQLAGLGEVQCPSVRPHVQPAWHLYPIRLRLESLGITRDDFIEGLAKRNIGASVHFIPVHLHPYYRNKYEFVPEAFPVAYDAFKRLVSLPLHPGLTDADVADVCDAVRDVVASSQR